VIVEASAGCRVHLTESRRNYRRSKSGFIWSNGGLKRPRQNVHRVPKNCAKLFSPELRQISTNFAHSTKDRFVCGALIFHHT